MPTKSKSQTTTRRARGRALVQRRLPTHLPPTHPGEMLREEFLVPMGITQSAFAVRLGVSFPRLNEVIIGKRAVQAQSLDGRWKMEDGRRKIEGGARRLPSSIFDLPSIPGVVHSLGVQLQLIGIEIHLPQIPRRVVLRSIIEVLRPRVPALAAG